MHPTDPSTEEGAPLGWRISEFKAILVYTRVPGWLELHRRILSSRHNRQKGSDMFLKLLCFEMGSHYASLVNLEPTNVCPSPPPQSGQQGEGTLRHTRPLRFLDLLNLVSDQILHQKN